MRPSSDTKVSLPLVATPWTNSTIAALEGPSFQDGRSAATADTDQKTAGTESTSAFNTLNAEPRLLVVMETSSPSGSFETGGRRAGTDGRPANGRQLPVGRERLNPSFASASRTNWNLWYCVSVIGPL